MTDKQTENVKNLMTMLTANFVTHSVEYREAVERCIILMIEHAYLEGMVDSNKNVKSGT